MQHFFSNIPLFTFDIAIIPSIAGCIFMEREIYFNTHSQKFILCLGFKAWAMQAIPVNEIRIRGQARLFWNPALSNFKKAEVTLCIKMI